MGKNTRFKHSNGKNKIVTDFPKERPILSSLVNYHMQNLYNSPPSFMRPYSDICKSMNSQSHPPSLSSLRKVQLISSMTSCVKSVRPRNITNASALHKSQEGVSLGKALCSKEIHHQVRCSAAPLPTGSTCSLLVWSHKWTSSWKVHLTKDTSISKWYVTKFRRCHYHSKIYHKPCKIPLVLLISKKRKKKPGKPMAFEQQTWNGIRNIFLNQKIIQDIIIHKKFINYSSILKNWEGKTYYVR